MRNHKMLNSITGEVATLSESVGVAIPDNYFLNTLSPPHTHTVQYRNKQVKIKKISHQDFGLGINQ